MGKARRRECAQGAQLANSNKLYLGKILLQKTLRIKFSVGSGFSNELYGKIRKPGNAGNEQKAF